MTSDRLMDIILATLAGGVAGELALVFIALLMKVVGA